MARTIVANFATRRDVETAVEHLVGLTITEYKVVVQLVSSPAAASTGTTQMSARS